MAELIVRGSGRVRQLPRVGFGESVGVGGALSPIEGSEHYGFVSGVGQQYPNDIPGSQHVGFGSGVQARGMLRIFGERGGFYAP